MANTGELSPRLADMPAGAELTADLAGIDTAQISICDRPTLALARRLRRVRADLYLALLNGTLSGLTRDQIITTMPRRSVRPEDTDTPDTPETPAPNTRAAKTRPARTRPPTTRAARMPIPTPPPGAARIPVVSR